MKFGVEAEPMPFLPLGCMEPQAYQKPYKYETNDPSCS